MVEICAVFESEWRYRTARVVTRAVCEVAAVVEVAHRTDVAPELDLVQDQELDPDRTREIEKEKALILGKRIKQSQMLHQSK